MTVYSIDVTMSSHALLKRRPVGITEARLPGSPHHHHRIVIEASDECEALLIAAQMAHTVFGYAMVTGAYLRV